MITIVTGKNQITIPIQLVRKLDIQPGTRLDWRLGQDGALIAQVLPQRAILARRVAGMGKKWLRTDDDPVSELIQERIQDDESSGVS